MSMKRVFSLAMAATMLLSATAFGATVDGTNPSDLEKGTDGKFHVTYTGATDGKEYMIWAVKERHESVADVSFAQANVLYINQNTADGSSVTFDGFLPMKSADSTLVITGQGMTKPVIIGYIKGEGNNVSGKIGLQGRSDGDLAGIVITFENDENEYSVTTDANGEFVLSGIADGTYAMRISRNGYLSSVDKTFAVSSDTVWEEEWTVEEQLLAGDINGDDVIDYFDLQPLLNNFDNEGIGDINEDGVVDYFDMQPLLNNYDKYVE